MSKQEQTIPQVLDSAPSHAERKTTHEILTDLCLKWLDKFPALTLQDYDKLMSQSQEEFNNQI
tara:strand:- start:103 stop:291 length:189 start_codon:yes stop_codon:yes gene_type:complete